MKSFLKHVAHVLIMATSYHLLNQLLFGQILTSENIGNLMGWGWYCLANIAAGLWTLLLFGVVRDDIKESSELRRQQSAHRFPVQVLTFSDPLAMGRFRPRCKNEDCTGFLARAVHPTNKEGVFCLKCGRSTDVQEALGKLADIGTKYEFL